MARSALEGFASGLQSGIGTRETSQRNNRINSALDYELSRIERGMRGDEELAAAEGYTDAGYNDVAGAAGLDDPYGSKLKDFFKGGVSLVKKGFGGIKNALGFGAQPEQVVPDQYTQEQVMNSFADGGEVDDDMMKRNYGEYYISEEEAAANRRLRSEGNDAPIGDGSRTRAGIDERKLANSRTGGGAMEYGRDFVRNAKEAGRAIGVGAPSAEAAGEEFRRTVGDITGKAIDAGREGYAMTPMSGLQRGIKGAGEFLASATGWGGDDTDVPADTAAAIDATDSVAAQPTGQPGGEQAPGSAGASQASAPTPSSGGAAAAIPGTAEPDAGFDWNSVQAPDEVPRMATKDWADYRRQTVKGLMMKGMSPSEAHMEVTKMQQQGFLSMAQQAGALLNTNPKAAAAAFSAAYQYFPNGSDVKFGVTQDKAGRPALVAMGFDEDTGERKGNPMLINEERMAAMITNFQDPQKFLGWTKDWRDEKMAREMFEVNSKIAARNSDTSRMNAVTNRDLAEQRRLIAGQTGGGLDDAAMLSFYRTMENDPEFVRLMMDENTTTNARTIKAIAEQVYAMEGGRNPAGVFDLVMKAYTGDPQAAQLLQQRYGVQIPTGE